MGQHPSGWQMRYTPRSTRIRRLDRPGVAIQRFMINPYVGEIHQEGARAILMGCCWMTSLVVFLRDWGKSPLVAGLVIRSRMVTFIALKVMGQTSDLMTLGGRGGGGGSGIDDASGVENISVHRDADRIHGGHRERATRNNGAVDRLEH